MPETLDRCSGPILRLPPTMPASLHPAVHPDSRWRSTKPSPVALRLALPHAARRPTPESTRIAPRIRIACVRSFARPPQRGVGGVQQSAAFLNALLVAGMQSDETGYHG